MNLFEFFLNNSFSKLWMLWCVDKLVGAIWFCTVLLDSLRSLLFFCKRLNMHDDMYMYFHKSEPHDIHVSTLTVWLFLSGDAYILPVVLLCKAAVCPYILCKFWRGIDTPGCVICCFTWHTILMTSYLLVCTLSPHPTTSPTPVKGIFSRQKILASLYIEPTLPHSHTS